MGTVEQASTDETHDRTGAAVVSADGFIPRCRSCDYDLSGLADGMCPECGRGFVREELFARWQGADGQTSWASVWRLVRAVVGVAALGKLMLVMNLGVQRNIASIAWILAGMWLLAIWEVLRRSGRSGSGQRRRQATAGYLLAATAMSLLASVAILDSIPIAACLLSFTLVALGALIPQFERTFEMRLYTAATRLISPLPMLALGVYALQFRPRQRWSGMMWATRPVTNEQAPWLGIAALTIAGMIVALWAGLWWRGRVGRSGGHGAGMHVS